MQTFINIGVTIFLFFIIQIGVSSSLFAANVNDIIFNEIAWAGSSVSGPTDEWIELKNNTNGNIDLSGYRITRYKESGEQTFFIFPSGNIIPANGFFLISERDKNTETTALQIDSDFIDNFILHDTLFQLKLYDDHNLLLDTAGDKGIPLRGTTGSLRSTMARMPDNAKDGTVKESWFTAQYSNNLDNDSINKGSPGNSSSAFSSAFPEVVYEDGEDGDINGWDIYDNNPATANISSSNGAIIINGEVMQKYYFSEYNTSSEADPENGNAIKFAGLQNTTHFNASFTFRTTNEKFTIYIRVKTQNGFRYLEYTPGSESWLGREYSSHHSWIDSSEYIHHYLGDDANDGQWHRVVRNLQRDLSDGNAGEIIEYVEGFYVRMTGEIDNFILLSE